MLILTRKLGDRIQVGEDVFIVNLGCSGKQVRLGIEAPAHIKVYRTELIKRIENSKK